MGKERGRWLFVYRLVILRYWIVLFLRWVFRGLEEFENRDVGVVYRVIFDLGLSFRERCFLVFVIVCFISSLVSVESVGIRV